MATQFAPAFDSVLSTMHGPSSRRLLDFIRHVERERSGKLPPPTLRLPQQFAATSTLRRKLRSMDSDLKADVLKYAKYLKKCQNVCLEQNGTRAKHRVSWWSPTPRWVVIEALKLAELGPSDVLFDLGCGDGRVVVDAARLFGAHAVGFDIDSTRVREARNRIRRARVRGRAQVRRQSILAIPDLYKATVIYLYLTERAIRKVLPALRRHCRKGTRIISVDNSIKRWPPEKRLSVRGKHYRWQIGLWYV